MFKHSLFLLFLIFSGICQAGENQKIYNDDTFKKVDLNTFIYRQLIDPGALGYPESQQLLKDLNGRLVFDHREIETKEDEKHIHFLISEVDSSNLDCGEVTKRPFKKVTMEKFSIKFESPIQIAFYKKLFKKRMLEIAELAQDKNPYPYWPFSRKMEYQWHSTILPQIKHRVLAHIGEEIGQSIISYLPFFNEEYSGIDRQGLAALTVAAQVFNDQEETMETIAQLRQKLDSRKISPKDDEEFVNLYEKFILPE